MDNSTFSLHHPYFINFLLYSLMNYIVGVLFTFLGLLIPYYDALQPHPPSYYSTLMMSQSFGYFIGCFSSKYIESHFSFHQVAAFGATILMVSLIGFASISTLVLRAIFFLCIGLGIAYINIYPIKLCFYCFKGSSLNRWIQLLEIFVPIGLLSASLIVYIFEMFTPFFLSFLGLIIAIFSMKIESPQNKSQQAAIEQGGNKGNKINSKYPLKFIIMYCISISCFIGITGIFNNWVPFYGTLKQVSSKQSALTFNFINQLSAVFIRILYSIINTRKNSIHIFALSALAASVCLVSYFLLFDQLTFMVLCLISCFFGAFTSPIMGLLLGFPTQYNLNPPSDYISIFFMAGELSGGIFSCATGWLMELWNDQSLFMVMAGGFITIFINNFQMISEMKKLKAQKEFGNQEKSNQIELLDINERYRQ